MSKKFNKKNNAIEKVENLSNKQGVITNNGVDEHKTNLEKFGENLGVANGVNVENTAAMGVNGVGTGVNNGVNGIGMGVNNGVNGIYTAGIDVNTGISDPYDNINVAPQTIAATQNADYTDNARKVELARIKSQKKQAKLRVKAEKQQAKERRRQAEIEKIHKLEEMEKQKKAQRDARKAMLKNESREQSAKRKAEEKQAKMKLKREKAMRKAEAKRSKIEAKREAKLRKKEYRQQNKRNRANRGFGGWLAAVISLGCAVLILASMLTLTLFTDYLAIPGIKNESSAVSQRNFYDLVGYVDNIETNMSKLFVSSDGEGQQKILGDIVVESNLAEASLAALPLQEESKHYTSKYINQVGDYAKYLNNRLIDGQKLSEEDYKGLEDMYYINLKLKDELNSLLSEIDQGYDFNMLKDNNKDDLIISRFNKLEEGAREYPQMIYDGAFSDGIESKEVKGLKGEEISQLEAKKIFESTFNNLEIDGIEVLGETLNRAVDCYNITAMSSDGREVYAQISKKGGKLMMFNAYKNCQMENFSEEDCEQIASDFLMANGFENMKCVWTYSENGKQHMNFAYSENDIIVYPDLVKVNVCRESGIVNGMDSYNYYLNHTERGVLKPKYTIEDAEQKVAQKMDISSRAYAVIPVGNGKEKLAYEFIGQFNDSTYYVYIDAQTLKEADIFKVIQTADGKLLI